MTGSWYSEVDDGPMYGEYIPYSIEDVPVLEFQYIAIGEDDEEIIDV
jgi:hypothetical protein